MFTGFSGTKVILKNVWGSESSFNFRKICPVCFLVIYVKTDFMHQTKCSSYHVKFTIISSFNMYRYSDIPFCDQLITELFVPFCAM